MGGRPSPAGPSVAGPTTTDMAVCISLQHGGIVLALRAGVGPAHVAGCLSDATSLVLGYPMQVTLEKMEHNDLDPPPPVLDSVGWR